MVFEGVIGLGIACLLAPVFAEYAKIRETAEKAFSMIAGAGVLFILAVSFNVTTVFSANAPQFASMGSIVFQFVGWILVLIGAIVAAYRLTVE